MRPIWQPLTQDDTPAADGIVSVDLPRGAISGIAITLKMLNITDEATLEQMLLELTRIEVKDQDGSPKLFTVCRDAVARSIIDTGSVPIVGNTITTDDATRDVSFYLMFGRYLGDPDYCYVVGKKGDVQLELTADIATTNADGLILQTSALELAGVSPKGYFKDLSTTITASAAGEFDHELKTGVPTVDALLFGTTVPVTTAWTATIEWLNFIHNSQNIWYQKIYWETLHGMLSRRVHSANNDFADVAADILDNYALLSEGDPKDPEHWIKTADGDSLKAHINYGDTNAARIIQRTVEQN